jgi:uncharacterized protein YndB with AHSA1/START domain
MNRLQRLAPDTLRLERLLDAPPEAVWKWLADPELRQQWFAGGTKAEQPGPFELAFDHERLSADPVPTPPQYAKHKGAVSKLQILRIEPPRLLEFNWGGGKEGIVTIELAAQGAGTHLVLTHRGISGPGPMADIGGGWTSHLDVLVTKVSGGAVRDFWALHRQSNAEVKAQLGG